MNQTKLYRICDLGSAELFMMPKPDGENLERDIQYFQDNGVNIVVSLLRDKEVIELGLCQEQQACRKLGIEFISFAVKDMDVPSLDDLKQLNQRLKANLKAGKSVAIHCHGGRGRAGTVAITLMQEFGYSADEACQIAQAGREDQNVPVCDIQREFVLNYKIAIS